MYSTRRVVPIVEEEERYEVTYLLILNKTERYNGQAHIYPHTRRIRFHEAHQIICKEGFLYIQSEFFLLPLQKK